MALTWYALHVKPHKERWVTDLLEGEGVEVYYPALRVTPVNPRSRKERPFFPGYVFVRVDLAAMGPNALRWTEGTHGLVHFGDRPSAVPDPLISEVRLRLEQVQREMDLGTPPYSKGDRVRITAGPFEGYEAIFDEHLAAKDRVQVLLTFLSHQSIRLQLHATDVDSIRTI